MSSTTTNLGLVKMASGETIGQWSDANNGSGANLDKIDTAIGNLNSHIDVLNGTGKDWITSANLNDYTTTGLYMIGATPTNAPADWGTLQVWSPSSTLVVQTYYRSGKVWTREYRSSDGWFSWRESAKIAEKRLAGGESAAFAFSNYQTAALIFCASGNTNATLYIYSNGYLAPVATDTDVTVTLSQDYKTVTVTNASSSRVFHVGCVSSNIPPTVT